MSALSRTSIALVIGDSITGTFPAGINGSVSWLRGYLPAVRARFGSIDPSVPPTSQQWPVFIWEGAAGRKVGDVAATFAAIVASYYVQFTHIFVPLAINDAQAIFNATLTLGQFTTNVDTLTTAALPFLADPSNLIWPGAWAHNAGDYDVQIGQVNTVIADKMTAVGGTYVPWFGISNGPEHSSDGTHPTTLAGAQALAAPVLAVT